MVKTAEMELCLRDLRKCALSLIKLYARRTFVAP